MNKLQLVIFTCCVVLAAAIDRKVLPTCFPLDEYDVVTPEGYQLSIFRLNNYGASLLMKNESVALAHGIMGNSNGFIYLQNDSIACILAYEGYDVWLLNFRGNDFGDTNINPAISSNPQKLWDFEFQNIGAIDMPALVDFILVQALRDQLHFVCHSAGCTIGIVMLTENPAYNLKVKSFNAMAPAVFLGQSENKQAQASAIWVNQLYASDYFNWAGIYKIESDDDLMDLLGLKSFREECLAKTNCSKICSVAFFLIHGLNLTETDCTISESDLDYIDSTASLKMFIHFAQLYAQLLTNDFRKFDYGWWENLFKYGSLTPSKYNLSLVRVFVHVFHAANDQLITEKNIDKLVLALPSADKTVVANLTHTDFAVSPAARDTYLQILANIANS